MRPCNPHLPLRSCAGAGARQAFLSLRCLPSPNCISWPAGPTSSASTSLSRSSRSRTTSQQWRYASSNRRWTDRQRGDSFARAAKVQGLKSRAAFKLLQINDRYRLFKPGMTVVDLGFAPGSWSQVCPSPPQSFQRVAALSSSSPYHPIPLYSTLLH